MLNSYKAIYRNAVLACQGILSPKQRRQPPVRLKGTARTTGDIVSSLFPEEEWDAMFERTAQQIEK